MPKEEVIETNKYFKKYGFKINKITEQDKTSHNLLVIKNP